MASSSSSRSKSSPKIRRGVDTLLQSQGKSLAQGEELRLVLVKSATHGPALVPDPINPQAPSQAFPLIAKFPECVVTPPLQQPPWDTARFYQQNAPKIQDDSDDEDAAGVEVKKRWRPRRKDPPKRQWILQEQVEFLEGLLAKRQQPTSSSSSSSSAAAAGSSGGTANGNGNDSTKTSTTNPTTPTVSTKYVGIPEHNPSQYVLLQLNNHGNKNSISVTSLPTPQATVTFAQPHARKTLSLSEAEHAIEDQRSNTSRFMMHGRSTKDATATMATTTTTTTTTTTAKNNAARQRLLGKLKRKRNNNNDEEEEEDDDVMGDIAYRRRKRGTNTARKELLNSLGDAGIKVDADGVLGGGNDAEFGRGQKFGRFQNQQNNNQVVANKDGDDEKVTVAAESTRGNDGLAMADDFYQRDVQAEYEELDYDVTEQFDDDDVDVGETDMVVETGGFAGDDDDEDEGMEEEDDGMHKFSGAEGLASSAGLRLMLAKARGEMTPEQVAEAAEKGKEEQQQAEERLQAAFEIDKRQTKNNEPQDHFSQIMAAAEEAKKEAEAKQLDAQGTKAGATAPRTSAVGQVQFDENGQRIITMDAVRREIWLHHGTIPMKRLMKIFDIKKKSVPERQNKFREALRELCTMETDPIGGRMLVLKQHYSNMG